MLKVAAEGFFNASSYLLQLIKKAHETSTHIEYFQWMSQTSEYEAWLSNRKSDFLWHTDPHGEDTSLLVASLLDMQWKATQPKDLLKTCLAYYFCQAGTKFKLFAILQSILAQLFQQQPEMVDRLVDTIRSSFKHKTTLLDSFSSNNADSNSRRTGLLTLFRVFMSLEWRIEVRIYFDNISVLEQRDRHDLLTLILFIVQNHQRNCLKIFLTTTSCDEESLDLLKDYQFVDQNTERNSK